MDLSHLIKKIGHSLVEIRVRAMGSVVSKLERSLLSVADLVQERRLFVVLLEWFNFPEVPLQDEVLGLLGTLSEHPSAAQMLRDVGAVEFLTQLSPNVEPRLRAVIDGTLDQLFHLPERLPAIFSHAQRVATAAVSPAPPEENSPQIGYFERSRQGHTDAPPQKIAVCEAVKCLKFSTFPWLTLTTTDRHILASNESSLRSNNTSVVRTTCELLRDVILQDFPAEIFLQRPRIVQNLLSLLRLSSGEGEAGFLWLQALACLRQLCVGLRSRLCFHQDPGFYSTKQDAVSQNSSLSYSQEVLGAQRSQVSSPGTECSPRPSVLGRTSQRARGDGQDGDVASNSGSSHGGATVAQVSPANVPPLELPDLGEEDMLELQLQQLSLAQFTIAVLGCAIPLLKTEAMHGFRRVLELLCDAVLLLGDSVSELVWEDGSLVGMELKEKLQTCMGLLGDILIYHQSCSADSAQSSLVHHRMAYMGTAILTIRMLQTVLPPEKAHDNLPDNMTTAVFHLCLDAALGNTFPSLQETAVAYLEQVNPDGHDLYRRVTRAALWMESTCSFLKEMQDEQGEKNWLELLELADLAIDGLPYHQHSAIVKECIHICSYLWRFDQPSPLLLAESQKVLLKLLAHPMLSVKTEAYTCTLSLVKDCLGIHNAPRTAAPCGGVHFLLHHKVLYEITAFGLQDSAEKVNSSAKDILLFLLKGRLMMTASTWDRFSKALYPVIPILQGYAGTEDSLGKCVLLISEASDPARDDVLPNTAKLRAALRLLFTKQHTVRAAAVQHIMPHLSSCGGSRPVLDQVMLSSIPTLYCLRSSLDITLDTSRKSFLKVESVEKLFGVLSCDTVDLSLRRSAAEQMAVVLQDTTMHLVLKNLGITDKVISFIIESVNGNKGLDGLLEPCFSILRKLAYADPSLRHGLAARSPLLLTLLRASFIVKENKGNGSETAALLCLLLFDEIARVEAWSEKSNTDVALATFSLPPSVTRRYNIPFHPVTHHAVSPYCCVVPSVADLLTLAPARQALQLAWNTAWYSGLDKLLEELQGFHSDINDFHSVLRLSEAQVLSVRTSHLSAGLQDCIQAIVLAAGHGSVRTALSRLQLYLLIDRLGSGPAQAPRCTDVLRSLSWQGAITRFLQVRPACLKDEKLLLDIVAFLSVHFQQMHSESMPDAKDEDLRWILELLLNQDTVSLVDYLLGVETQTANHSQGGPEEMRSRLTQRLQREVTSFFTALLHRLENTTDRICLALSGPFMSQLAIRLLQSLRVSDAPRFYGLPSLERTLLGMVTLTARPGWSSHCPDQEPLSLCSKYLSGLLEVISSFYVEWGGNATSFMGKGVTKNAVICLLHLSHEMITESKGKDLISQWSLGHEAGTEEASGSQLGLAWLIPLWVDRDPEVRFASLGVGRALSSAPSGCWALCASCQNISGGLWGTLLSILLDQQECSLVRREAAFILQNLLVMPMPANEEDAEDSSWKNPCVHDEVSGVSLVGLPALQALLYHCHYFQHVALCVSVCYTGRFTFNLQPSLADGSSPQESTSGDSEDSLRLWSSSLPASAVDLSRASSSLSTSSTVIRGSGPHTPTAPSPLTAEESPASRLMAQGQSDTDTSDSAVSQDSRQGEPLAVKSVAMVTPDLLTAHCGLLTNLLAVLPDFTLAALGHGLLLKSLASLVDAKAIEKCLSELKSPITLPGERDAVRNQVVALLQLVSGFSRLLQSCVTVNQELIGQTDFLKPLLTSLVTVLMLDTKCLDAGTRRAVCVSWAHVFTLLATLVRGDVSVAFPSVSVALGRRWKTFSATLSVCVSEEAVEPGLHTVALQFLCAVFSEESKQCSSEAPEALTPLCNILSGPPASHLCELLLQSFEKRSLQDPMKMPTARALMSLLACSPTAQHHAVKAGLIDSCVEQMRQSHSQLNLESIRPGKAAHRRKEDGCLKEVKLMAEILRNTLYRNDGCKMAATDARLAPAIHALWPWLLLDDPTMEEVLELLCVYTANCTAACSSLCGGGLSVGPGPRGPPGGSLMHCIMKLASGIAPDNSLVQKLAFSLLANLTTSRDCRCLLQKSNFLQALLSVPAPKASSAKASGAGGGLLGMWLRLLLSLSFGEDGQQSILRVSGALELLADLASNRRHALLVLHNLCFCPANKPHVLANDKAMRVLVSSLESKEVELRSMAASALWALLYNNQRAKTNLKCFSVQLRLKEARVMSLKDAANNEHPTNTYLLKCLENLSQLLKS